MERKIYLTGIKPTGKLHLGNYCGSIKPILEILKNEKNVDVLFFVADYHAMTSQPNPAKLARNTEEMMKSLVSIFYSHTVAEIYNNNENRIFLYRQSKIPEIFEYNWILSCFTAKGLLNRNHSYKQERERNIASGKDEDKGIFAGLYNYPVLMASDILIMNADYVPVGKDQIQHIEIANDIADKINHFYNTEHFSKIDPIVERETMLPGTDGQKMSKSYNNTVSLFDINEIKKYIYKIKTNFKGEGEPKYPEESNISEIYRAFSTYHKEYYDFQKDMERGKGWKELKDLTFQKVMNELDEYILAYSHFKERDFQEVIRCFKNGEYLVSQFAKRKLYELKKICGMKGGDR